MTLHPYILHLILVVVGLAAGSDLAGARQGGILAGRITDGSGGALPQATVTVYDGASAFTVTTGRDGAYRFTNLEPGEYHITVTKRGFRPVCLAGLTIRAGDSLSIGLVLEIEPVEQSVDVVGRRRPVGSSVTFPDDELRVRPLSTEPLTLLPSIPGVVAAGLDVGGSEAHANKQFVFRGSRALDTAWTIDGVAVSDRQTGTPLGTYDLTAFEEVRFAAASGDITRPGSGLGVNMVIRSGTNELRGGARGFYSDHTLQAAPAGDRGDHTRQIHESGADAGGPLRRGRAWFRASASRRDVRVVRQAGGDERAVLTPRSLKTNWRLTLRDMMNVLWLDHGVTRHGVNPSAFRAPGTALQHQSPLYPEGPFRGLWKVEYQRGDPSNRFLAARYAYYGTGFQNLSVGTGQAGMSPRTGETLGATSSTWSVRPQHSIAVDGTYFRKLWRSRHEIKFGGGWQRIDMFNRTQWPGDGVVAFDISPTDQRARIYREANGRNRLFLTSAYISDVVSTGPVTLDFGLRFDHQRGEGLPGSVSANRAFPGLLPGVDFGGMETRGSVAVSPRAGATYALDPGGRTLLRGSIGRYASQQVIAVVAQTNPANLQAWIEYPWQDFDGDRLVQPAEVRVDLPYLAFEGLNPADPASSLPRTTHGPDLRSRMTTELSVGIEHQIGRHLGFALGYSYARHTRWPSVRWQGLSESDYVLVRTLTATLPDGTPASVPLYEPDPAAVLEHGGSRIITTDASYYSTFQGVEASIVRRMSGGWMVSATGAWNDSRSFYRQSPATNSIGNPTRLDGATGGGPLSSPKDPLVHGGQVAPVTLPLAGGARVFMNARWQASLSGATQLPFGFEAGGSLFGREGTPSPYFIPQGLGLDGNRSVLVSPAIDSVRLDDVWNLDLRLARRLRYRGATVQVIGDLFNALNGAPALAKERNLRSPNFDRVSMTLHPRILRLGLRISH